MNETIHPGMMLAVNVTVKQLTDEELSCVYLAAALKQDPRNVEGYEKARSLFTEENGTRMSDTVLSVLTALVSDRFPEKK